MPLLHTRFVLTIPKQASSNEAGIFRLLSEKSIQMLSFSRGRSGGAKPSGRSPIGGKLL
jgi:hypothetical protein